MAYAKSVTEFFEDASHWKAEIAQLRDITAKAGLDEQLKWGMPHYHYKGQNLFGICGFKSYFGFWFHQGAMMADPDDVLINAQPEKTKMLRQWRMTSRDDIKPERITAYIEEAVRVAQAENG